MHEMLQGAALFSSVRRCEDLAAFWWLGQHSFALKLGDARLLIDPFLSPVEGRRVPPLFAPADAEGHVDIVACTHDHIDHIDPVAVQGLAEHTQAVFVAPRAHAVRMKSLGVSSARLVLLDDDERAEVHGVRFHGVKAAHEFFDRTPEGYYPYLGYVIKAAGRTVYHAGDTLWWEGLQQQLAAWTFDLALVPINGRDGKRLRNNTAGNMTFQEAADLLGGLDVALAVPTHYDMFAHNSEDPERFREYVEVKYPGRRVWIGPPTTPVAF